jgi:hypothetical protein
MAGYLQDDKSWVSMTSKMMDVPYFQGKISTYIPFNFSSGGWYRGVVPRLSYTITNDMFNSSMPIMSYDPEMGAVQDKPAFVTATDGSNSVRQYLSGSIRAYTILGTPNSAVYPKWGIGVEAGATGSIGLSRFLSPMGYLYGYGYVPGLVPQQGLKLSVMYQRKLREDAYFGQPTVSVVPRGLANNATLMSYLSIYYDNLTKISADYAIPIYIGDIGIGGYFLYLKRLVLTPHFDFNIVEDKPYFFSAGTTLAFDLESICFITWPCSIGVTYSYNGDFNGAFDELRSNDISFGRHFVGPVFSVTF